MKVFLLGLLFFCACTRKNQKEEEFKEYVLIEFAAKLEEDYHRMHPVKMNENIPLPNQEKGN